MASKRETGGAEVQDVLPGGNELFEVLQAELRQVAVQLGLALGLEGETFTPPLDTHLRGKILLESSAAASLGPDALTRHDGKLEITVSAKAGLGMSTAAAVASQVVKYLPRGKSLPLERGEITLRSHELTTLGDQTDRSRVLVHIPFYAFTKE